MLKQLKIELLTINIGSNRVINKRKTWVIVLAIEGINHSKNGK